MTRIRTSFAITAVAACVGAFAAGPASGAVVTVGSPMTGNYSSQTLGSSHAVFNTLVPGNNVSPVTGAVIGWNIEGASGGPFTLRVIQPVNSTEYIGGGRGTPVSPLSTAFQHFSADVPIKTGEMVAFDHANSTDKIGAGTSILAANRLAYFISPLEEGVQGAIAPSAAPLEVAFNAEVQPAPVVTALGTTAGPTSGGTSVLIAGTDLENATAVTFGGTPASISGSTEGSIVATSPPSASGGSVPVVVTTLAGSSTASQAFVYQAPPTPPSTPPLAAKAQCKVPNVVGKKLAKAKTKLKAASCALGKVTKSGKAAKVVKQSPKAGAVKAAGTKVAIKLG